MKVVRNNYKKLPTGVFDKHMEMMLCDYLKNSARMYFGLTPVEVRKLAYELGIKNDLKLPHNWLENWLAKTG